MSDHMTIEDKKWELKEFIYEEYQDNLPVFATDADVNVLWIASNRMQTFKEMSRCANNKNDSDFFYALYEDYQMLFYGMLYAISKHSDNVAELRHELAQKNAQGGANNIDVWAS